MPLTSDRDVEDYVCKINAMVGNEMIDRVAAALFPRSMESGSNSDKAYARSQARLAIEAMREPTEPMVMAYGQTHWELYDGKRNYSNMIDAALSEDNVQD